MKRLFLLIVLSFISMTSAFANNNSAEDHREFEGGRIVVTGSGNYYEIIDNEKNVCVYIRVEETRNSFGEEVYNIMCENELTKGINKAVLGQAISTALANTDLGFLGKVVSSYIYDKVCEYFE